MTLVELKERIMASGWINKNAMIKTIDGTVFEAYARNISNFDGVFLNFSVFASFTEQGLRNHIACLQKLRSRQEWINLLCQLRREIARVD